MVAADGFVVIFPIASWGRILQSTTTRKWLDKISQIFRSNPVFVQLLLTVRGKIFRKLFWWQVERLPTIENSELASTSQLLIHNIIQVEPWRQAAIALPILARRWLLLLMVALHWHPRLALLLGGWCWWYCRISNVHGMEYGNKCWRGRQKRRSPFFHQRFSFDEQGGGCSSGESGRKLNCR